MATDRRLIELHSRQIGIGFNGNLLLDTIGIEAGQIQSGLIPHLMGKGLPSEITITNAIGASANLCNISFQVSDAAGNAVAMPVLFDIWLSDAATGANVTGTAPSGGIAVGASGVVWSTPISNKALRVQASAAGLFVLVVTDTAKTLYYPCAQSTWSGIVTVGAQLTTASYHT